MRIDPINFATLSSINFATLSPINFATLSLPPKEFTGVPAYPSSEGERRRSSAVPSAPGSADLKSSTSPLIIKTLNSYSWHIRQHE